ncbi:hypothetical protein Taro_013645 [Colocasia esculenta]|uniref:Uncharacterized protein n=1 Tax=Colocasia esculenta TaxID=4460 RepID=A0A843UGL4_COLES|nr:hypothetical protein [Colocasia esculenta]
MSFMKKPSRDHQSPTECHNYLGDPDPAKRALQTTLCRYPHRFPLRSKSVTRAHPPPEELPLTGTRGWGSQSQVRKRERNYTVVGLGYTS